MSETEEKIKEATDTCEMGMGEESKPMRDTNWSESGIETKVERLRNVVRNLERELEKMAKYTNQLIGHSHAEGKIVKELSHPYNPEPIFYPYRSRGLE